MLNKEEQELYNKMLDKNHSHEYLIEQLDINPGHPLYASYYNPSPESLEERYMIQQMDISGNGCHVKLVDTCIRNDFYGCILISNSVEILIIEKQRLIKKEPTFDQLSLFDDDLEEDEENLC